MPCPFTVQSYNPKGIFVNWSSFCGNVNVCALWLLLNLQGSNLGRMVDWCGHNSILLNHWSMVQNSAVVLDHKAFYLVKDCVEGGLKEWQRTIICLMVKRIIKDT